MQLRGMSAAFVATAVLSLSLSAQTRPDFSGDWVMLSPEAGQTMQVKQDATTLIQLVQNEPAISHKLDGTQGRTSIPVHEGQDVVILSSGVWKGGTLELTMMTTYPNGTKRESRQMWSLATDGTLKIDFTDRLNTPAEKTTQLAYKKAQKEEAM